MHHYPRAADDLIGVQQRLFDVDLLPTQGWVYAGVRKGLVKIGHSVSPPRRKIELRMELLGMVPGSKRDEARIHHSLWDDHICHEWFNASPRVVAWVRSLPIRFALLDHWPPNPGVPVLRTAA